MHSIPHNNAQSSHFSLCSAEVRTYQGGGKSPPIRPTVMLKAALYVRFSKSYLSLPPNIWYEDRVGISQVMKLDLIAAGRAWFSLGRLFSPIPMASHLSQGGGG